MFDFLKKDSSSKAADKEKKEATYSQYTLLVEDAFTLKDRDGLVVVGDLHGDIKVGDMAYICHHTRPLVGVRVKAIEIGKDKQAESASNQPVALLLEDLGRREDAPKYSVISGTKPQDKVDVNKEVENPMLLGLTMGYGKFVREEQYLNTLIYAATHAIFITPVKMDKAPVNNGDGTATFEQGTTVSFVGVSNPDMPGVSILPIFTDRKALGINKNFVSGEDGKDTMILRFPDVVSVSNAGYEGVVINPYGPVPVFLPKELIEHITTLEGYKAEFGK